SRASGVAQGGISVPDGESAGGSAHGYRGSCLQQRHSCRVGVEQSERGLVGGDGSAVEVGGSALQRSRTADGGAENEVGCRASSSRSTNVDGLSIAASGS